MAETNATILIPDISGFTEFMTTTELSHSSYAINLLIDAIISAVGDAYEVSEIEGDAVLFIKKGPAPTQEEIMNICLKIFHAFHYQRKWMQQYTVCPCGACQAITNLTLKFVVHHGPLAEIKVGGFTKQSGTEMIVAHRLLKNNIDNHEYLLVTEKLFERPGDAPGSVEVEWAKASEEYASIGKVDFRFTLLSEARKGIPDPPVPGSYKADDTSYTEIQINAGFMDVYMAMMYIPGRPEWLPGLQKVEQDKPGVYIGSIHVCTFEDFEAVVSPMRMTISADGIIYAESCTIKELGISMIHEFVFKKTGENTSTFAARFMNAGESPIPAELQEALQKKIKLMGEGVKAFTEKAQ
jgi:hypothetical protein